MSHAHTLTLNSIYFYIFELFRAFLIVSFFPPPFLSLVYISVSWHQNVSLLLPKILFISGHHLLLILPLPLFGFVMRMPKKTSRKTFLDEVFIRNIESFRRTSLTLIYLLSFIVGVGSQCVTSRSHVHSC